MQSRAFTHLYQPRIPAPGKDRKHTISTAVYPGRFGARAFSQRRICASMTLMTKYIIGAVVVIVLAAAGYLLWARAMGPAATPTPPPAPPAPVTHTFSTSTFSIIYPD